MNDVAVASDLIIVTRCDVADKKSVEYLDLSTVDPDPRKKRRVVSLQVPVRILFPDPLQYQSGIFQTVEAGDDRSCLPVANGTDLSSPLKAFLDW